MPGFKSILISFGLLTSICQADPIIGLKFANGKITIGPSDYSFKQFYCRETKGEKDPRCVVEYDLGELIRSKTSTLNLELQYKFGTVDQRPTAADTPNILDQAQLESGRLFKKSIKNPEWSEPTESGSSK